MTLLFFPLQTRSISSQSYAELPLTMVYQTDGTPVWGCPAPRCSKSYSTAAGCRQHMDNTHVKSQQHICQFCSKVFSNRSGLRNHKIIKHNGNASLRCLYCNDPFLSKPLLTNHTRKCPNRFHQAELQINSAMSLTF